MGKQGDYRGSIRVLCERVNPLDVPSGGIVFQGGMIHHGDVYVLRELIGEVTYPTSEKHRLHTAAEVLVEIPGELNQLQGRRLEFPVTVFRDHEDGTHAVTPDRIPSREGVARPF